MKSAWPWPAGDHSTRQWLTRSARVLPPSLERRMNEFSPVMTTSCGSTICGSAMVRLLVEKPNAGRNARRLARLRAEEEQTHAHRQTGGSRRARRLHRDGGGATE